MKIKTLISCAVTAKLICVFVFAYAKSSFSNDAANMMVEYFSAKPRSGLIIEHVAGLQNSSKFSRPIEPRCEKTVFGVSDQVRHKPGCTAREDGSRLVI